LTERAGADAVARFRAEAEAIARLQHSNIVQIYEVGEHEGQPYFSLEFVDGGSLDRRIQGTPQPPEESARLVHTLALALQSAHEKNVIHRDLKPANILLQTQERTTGDTGNTWKESKRNGLLLSSPAPRSRGYPAMSPVVPLLPKVTDFGLAKQL